jgi:hypothetical protein
MSTVKLHPVHAPASESHIMGEEPTWHDVDIAEDRYNHEMTKGFNWHSAVADTKDYHKYINEWIHVNLPAQAKKFSAAWGKVSEKGLIGTIPTMARMQLRGFTLSDKHSELIVPFITELVVASIKESAQAGIDNPQPTIQDRMRTQVQELLGDIDEKVDIACDNIDETVYLEDLKGKIISQNLKGPQTKIVTNHIDMYTNRWKEAQKHWNGKGDSPEEQLAQGYAYLTKTRLNSIIKAFVDLSDTITNQVTKTKITKIRKKRPTDKKKLVSKLKHLTVSVDLGIESISPVSLLESSSVWVYDTQKRKLGHYVAEFNGSIHVKGTTILGVRSSYQKTLRKPEEQLAEFQKLGKALRDKWFADIKAKGQVMTGRTNSNMLLLRAD